MLLESCKGQNRGQLRRVIRIIGLLLAVIASLHPTISKAERQDHGRLNLFALSLEELTDIRVVSATWTPTSDQGIFTLGRQTFLSALFDSAKRGEDDHLSAELGLQMKLTELATAPNGIVVAVDGFTIGTFRHAAELRQYARLMEPYFRSVELYIGESALWWSGHRADTVVNFVTSAAAEQDRVESLHSRLRNTEVRS